MQQVFSREFMYDNCGCYTPAHLSSCSFMQNGSEITLRNIVNSEIALKDKFWFVCRILATKEENRQIAIFVAELVLPIYEKRYPENTAPREAIEAAKQFIAGHICLSTLMERVRAAHASAHASALAAAHAADAFAHAAHAANAAATAAGAAGATHAVYTAIEAASAVYAAANAADADGKKQLVDYLLTFCEY